MKKTCTKCGEEKDLSSFYRRKTGKHGVHAQCKVCMKKQAKQYIDKLSKKEKEERKMRQNQWRRENQENITKRQRLWKIKNSDRVNELRRLNYQRNIVKKREETSRRQKEAVEHLLPRYVKQRIVNQSRGFLATSDITAELLEMKTLELRLFRHIKLLKNEKQ